MPSWQQEFLNALQERDKSEKANQEIFSHYARLADRIVSQPNKSGAPAPAAASPAPSPAPSTKKTRQTEAAPVSSDAFSALRRDFAESQRNRASLESKLQSATAELQSLRTQVDAGAKAIADVSKERDTLSRGVKDRDEEIKGKAKLLEDIHDETVSLTLQLNMADERARKMETENKDLVERWMKRMGKEADQMNETSKFS